MKRAAKKCFAYMAWRNNEAGFTFLSLLFGLAILMITLPLFIYFLGQLHVDADDFHIQVHHFFIFLSDDTKRADRVYVNDNKLFFELSTDQTAKIEQYGDQIRRQVRNELIFEGHEIYLRDVETAVFAPLDYGYHITLTMTNGDIYEKTITK